MKEPTRQQQIIDLLSEEIAVNLRAQANEERAPGFDPDRMDEIIKERRTAAMKLRGIRQDLEILFSGVCS